MKNLTPPSWAPYAIATDQGWTHPKTGEILVSYRGLKTRIDAQMKSQMEFSEPTVEDATVTVSLTLDTPVQTGSDIIEEKPKSKKVKKPIVS